MSGVEWQVAGASSVLHLIDTDQGRRGRSGPRAFCGRYPQRNEHAWFGLSPSEGVAQAARTYRLTFCPDCSARKG